VCLSWICRARFETKSIIRFGLLYSPRGIRLHDARDETWAEDRTEDERYFRGGFTNLDNFFDQTYLEGVRAEYNSELDNSEDDDDPNDRLRVLGEITTDHQIPTSILYVNHQVYLEASQYCTHRIASPSTLMQSSLSGFSRAFRQRQDRTLDTWVSHITRLLMTTRTVPGIGSRYAHISTATCRSPT